MLLEQLKETYKLELNSKETRKTLVLTRQHIIEILSSTKYITDLRFGDIMDMQNLMKGSLNPFEYFELEQF